MADEPTPGDDLTTSRRLLLGVTATALVGTAGCLARGEPSDLEGEIRMDGSNTVLPHGAVVSEEFQWRNNRVQIPVNGSGTGAGFQRFCRGETHAQNASREILPEEEALCTQHATDYVELQTALDGIAVFVHPENDWCTELTVEELARLWEPGSTVESWRDLRPDDPAFPDEPIELYGRDPASGTFDYFTEAITGEIGAIRSDYSASADTNVIVRGVRGSEYALGFGGVGYYKENRGELDAVPIDDGDGPVYPSAENVESGAYTPLTRPLFTYFRADALAREDVRAFARFYFEPIDGHAVDAEFVDDPADWHWTQWGARRVGYNAIPTESDDPDEPSVEASAAILEEAIAEVVG